MLLEAVLTRINLEYVLYTTEILCFPKGLQNYCHTCRLIKIKKILYILTWCVAYKGFFSNSDGKRSL